MIIDHIGFYFFPNNLWLRIIGRGAAPLFYFLIGYSGKLHTSFLLYLYGIILSTSAYFVSGDLQVNILLTFVLINFVMALFPAPKLNTLTRILAFCALGVATIYTYKYFEYGGLGILLAYCGRLIALEDKQAHFWLLLVLCLYFVWETIYFHIQSMPMLYTFAFIILCLYLFMSQYRLKTLTCPSFLLIPSLVISRYSLEVYFFHLILFRAIYFLHLT